MFQCGEDESSVGFFFCSVLRLRFDFLFFVVVVVVVFLPLSGAYCHQRVRRKTVLTFYPRTGLTKQQQRSVPSSVPHHVFLLSKLLLVLKDSLLN